MSFFIPVPTGFSTVPAYQSNPFVSGLNMAVTGDTTFTMSPGACRALTNNYVLQFPSYSPNVPGNVTVDISTQGLNGCYPSSIASLSLASNTVFPVYAVANSSGTATVPGAASNGPLTAFVVATGNNFLPPNMDMFRRVAWVYVDYSTGEIIPWDQFGQGTERTYLLQDPVTALSGGVADTPTAIDLTNNSGVGVVPPSVVSVNLNLSLTGTAVASYLYVEPTGLTAGSVTPTQLVTPTASEPLAANMSLLTGLNTSGDSSINYWVDSGSSATILVAGFTESLGNTLY